MNKFFTLLAAAGLAMSAQATILWEGECVYGAWKGMFEYKADPANCPDWNPEVMATIKEGDKIVLHYTDVSTDASKPGQCQFNLISCDAGWSWEQVAEAAPIVGGKYTYTVKDEPVNDSDYTDVEMLSTRGFTSKGQGATLVKVELLQAGETSDPGTNPGTNPGGNTTEGDVISIWKGSVEFGAWKGMFEYKADPANCPDWDPEVMAALEEGDKIVLLFDAVSTDASKPGQVQFNLIDCDATWSWNQIVEAAPIVGKKFTYTIKDEPVEGSDYTDLEMLQQRGFTAKGQGATLVEVQIHKAGGNGTVVTPPAGASTLVLWEGEVVYGAWKGMFEYKADPANCPAWDPEKVATAVKGSKIVMYFTDLSTDASKPAQNQFNFISCDAGWSWVQVAEAAPIVGGKYTYTIKDEPVEDSDYTDLEMFSQRGFTSKGQGATLVKVELQNPGNGQQSIDAAVANEIDFNAPVEIYTIDGRRVAEMTAGRIYILRQGNNVRKVAK